MKEIDIIKLLKLVADDAQLSHEQLAVMLGVTVREISDTIAGLEQKGIIRGYNGEINAAGLGEIHNFFNILDPDLRNAHGVLGDAAVAGEGVNGLNPGIFPQLFDDGVFAASAADD